MVRTKAGKAPLVQFIKTPSGDELAVLPRAAYEALIARVDPHAGDLGIPGQLPETVERAKAPGALNQDLEDRADHAEALAAYRDGRSEALTADEMRALLAAPTPLAFWRKKRGLTQRDLAAKAEIPQGYLSQLEAGKKGGTPDTLKRLAQALGIGLDDLVD